MLKRSFKRLRTDEPAHLLGGGNARRGRPRGFRADIDDVGSQLFEFDSAGKGAVGIGVLAAVGKGIRRDIEHRHQDGALAELESPGFSTSSKRAFSP